MTQPSTEAARAAEQRSRNWTSFVDVVRTHAASKAQQRLYRFVAEDDAAGASITYAETDRQARAIAAALQQISSPGDRALLLYPPGLEYITAFLGCLYAGVVAVPAYPPDPTRLQRTLPRIQAIVSDARATIALTTTAIESMAGFILGDAPDLQALRWLATDALPAGSESEWRAPDLTPSSLAFLQYTSGSTGTPKGVMLSHGNLLHNSTLIQHCFQTKPTSRGVFWLPFYHDMGLIGGLLQTIYCGGESTLMSPIDFLRKPLSWLQAISRSGAEISGGPNFAYDLAVRKTTPEERASLDLRTWELAFCGAEPIRPETIDRFVRAFEPCGFRRESFYPCYGLAEATLIASGGRRDKPPVLRRFAAEALERGVATESANEPAFVSCGQTLPQQRIEIVSPDTLVACPPGRVGEIWLHGPSVALGYWDRPEESERMFEATIAGGDGTKFLRTGDLGFLIDGELFVTGRLKDLVIIRGRNFAPQDLELSAERSHPAVRPGCGAAFSVDVNGEEKLVIVQEFERRYRPDRRLNAPPPPAAVLERRGPDRREGAPEVHAFDGEKAIEAARTRKSSAPPPPLDPADVARAIRQSIAEHHQLQTFAVVLIKAGTIPKTSSGKIQRHASRAAFLDGSLDVIVEDRAGALRRSELPPALTADGDAARPGSAPPNASVDILGWLRPAFARLVGIPARDVDVDRSIFSYGLDSLRSVELQYEVERATGAVLPATFLMQGGSLRELAARIGLAASQHANEALSIPAPSGPEHPLSFGQQALWYLQSLEPESTRYTINRAASLAPPIDLDALVRSIRVAAARHAVLRTRYEARDGDVVATVDPAAEPVIRITDAAGWTSNRLHDDVAGLAARPIDITRDPPIRVGLWRTGNGGAVVLLSIHHIATDFWSIGILLRDIGALYACETSQAPVSLKRPEARYADFVQWQRRSLDGAAGAALRTWWLDNLDGAPDEVSIPTDRPRPAVLSPRGATRSFALGREVADRVRARATEFATTPFVMLLAAFYALVQRYSGDEDLIVGSPAAGRARASLADVAGYFVNMLPLRVRVRPTESFATLVSEVRRVTLDAVERQDYPFARIVEDTRVARDASRSPVFQLAFVLQQVTGLATDELAALAVGGDGHRARVGSIELESFALDQTGSQFDLTMYTAQTAAGIVGAIEYSTDLYDADTIDRFVQHFYVLLTASLSAPEAPLAKVDLLDAEARRRLLTDWSGPGAASIPTDSVCASFAVQALDRAEAIAVEAAGVRWTYATLDALASSVARTLADQGIQPGAVVGLVMRRSAHFVAAALGVLKAGCAYLPLDTATPAARIAYALTQSRATAVIVDRLGTVSTAHEIEFDAIAAAPRQGFASRDVPLESPAYVIFTSGSTGEPKGVVVSHGALSNLAAASRHRMRIGLDARSTMLASIGFDASVWECWPTLCAGGTLLVPPDEVRTEPATLAAWIVAERVTHAWAPTPLATAILPYLEQESGALRLLSTGGDRLVRRPSKSLPFEFLNAYGPTEVAVVSTWGDVAQESATLGLPSIGQPIENLRCYVLDSSLSPVPVGLRGELYVGGVGVALGYAGAPALTAERFVPDPFAATPGARMYRTGDVVRWRADRALDFLGRADDQLKIRGYRIEPGEVEAAIRTVDGVTDAVACGRRGRTGELELRAYYVGAPEPSAVRLHLASRLPAFMVPSAIVRLESLPLNASGKVDRGRLPEPPAGSTGSIEFVALEGPVQTAIAAIWSEILGVPRVGAHDQFFEIGGHSLRVSQVVARVRTTFGIELPVRELFDHPTLSAFAERVEAAVVAQIEAMSEEEAQDLARDT